MATLASFIIFLIISLWLGSYSGFIGVVFFCMCFFPSLKFTLSIDIARGVYNDHHRRNDERAKKTVESLMAIEQRRHENAIKEQLYKDYLERNKALERNKSKD